MKSGSAHVTAAIPVMVLLPIAAMVLLQKRLVSAEKAAGTAAVTAPSAARPEAAVFNGFPYLQVSRDSFDAAKAIAACREQAVEHVKTLGPTHPESLIARNNLANALVSAGQNAEAEQIERVLLEDMERLLPEGHPDVFRCRFNLAMNLRMQGKLPEARQEMEQVYEGWRKVLGEGHPRTQSALLVLENLRQAH